MNTWWIVRDVQAVLILRAVLVPLVMLIEVRGNPRRFTPHQWRIIRRMMALFIVAMLLGGLVTFL